MLKTSESLFMIHNMPDWVTIQEAVDITTEAIKQKNNKTENHPR